MERETKKITIGKLEIELKTYLTFGESREISDIYLQNASVGVDMDGKTKISDIKASISTEVQNKAIEIIVVSIDGKKENILDSILNLPDNDGKELMNEIDKIQNPLTEQKKTT